MKAIILGHDRAEIITIQTKDFDKHFLQTRMMSYKIFPDALTRMRVYKNGTEMDSEEVIVFPENGIVPHNSQGVDYSPMATKNDIDHHKDVRAPGFFNRFKFWVDTGGSIWKGIAPYAGLIIAGLIVAWAFLSN